MNVLFTKALEITPSKQLTLKDKLDCNWCNFSKIIPNACPLVVNKKRKSLSKCLIQHPEIKPTLPKDSFV